MNRTEYYAARQKLAHLPDSHPAVVALQVQYAPQAAAPAAKRPTATRVGGFMADAPENDPRNQPTIRNGAGGQSPNPQYRPPK